MTDNFTEKNRRILIIDDNHAIHDDFRKIFITTDTARSAIEAEEAEIFGTDIPDEEQESFNVDSAFQGEKGAEMVRQARQLGRPYAMAIVDMRMPPGWDGVQTALEIWKHDPDVQIVICTAYADHSWTDMLKAIGSGDRMIVLKKPFEPVEAFQMANMLTEKWHLQQQARQKMEDLEAKVKSRTDELRRSNEELLGKNEEIQYFYHTLSHELKTPLTSAREFISIVSDGLAGDISEVQQGYLNIARESCTHLSIYINDLLDSTRLDTGKLRLVLKPASLTSLIRRVMTIMKPLADSKSIRLGEDLDSSIDEIMVDESRITQILTNLYNNALKFTADGGEINVKLYRDPDSPEKIEIAVSDDGCGIAREQVGHLFDRYYQVEQSGSVQVKGVGLGLYLCRELVLLHGGDIRVESQLGTGSTFTFSLPVEASTPEHAPNRITHLPVVQTNSVETLVTH